jgi:hypothetical protein
MAQRESIIIGDKEYAASKIGAFEANGLILKLQKLILPVVGELAGDGKAKVDVMNMDVSAAFQVISEKLDDSVMTDIVLPMFKLSQVAIITGEKMKIDSPQSINKVFQDADGLADLYELIYEVLKFNFGSFFTKLMARFGSNGGNHQEIK